MASWADRLFWRSQNLSVTHAHTCIHLLWFSHVLHRSSHQLLSALSFPLKCWLHATLHRRYQGNWQWLEICSIIEPRPVWLTGLGPPLFKTNPSSKAISDIQFVLKLPLRGPQGPDLINIFYGEPLDVAGSASGPVLIIVRAHYGGLCDDSDSEAWQWFMNASVMKQRSDWSLMGQRFLIFARPLCDCAVSLTVRPCQLEANQKWFM